MIFFADTNTLKNLVLIYLVKFMASSSDANAAYKYDCEHTEFAGAYSGFPKTFVSFPEPPASGIKALGLSMSW